MFELTKGKMRLVIYNPKDVELYVKAGWKVIPKKKRKPNKNKPKTVASNSIDITDDKNTIVENVVTEIEEEK